MNSDLPISFTDVTVVAGGVTLLDQISITISAGAPTVLIGPNGSGKTTFLRVAMGLIPPSRGRITWGGREHSPPASRAIVFQRPVMFRRTVAGNVCYALSPGAPPVTELLALVGLETFKDRPARRLSGGEQQRLAVARALARNPGVLLLDEPTASLDPAATKQIEDVVQTVSARGVKIVMATHDLGEARRLAGEIVFLDRGGIVESGPSDAFFAAPSTVRARQFLAGDLLI